MYKRGFKNAKRSPLVMVTRKKPHDSEDSTDEPPRKKVKGKPKEKESAVGSPLGLCDLPTEMLEKIIGYINIWHHNRIRGTSKRLRDVNDVFVWHEFRKALKRHTTLQPNSYESAVLQVIDLSTTVYVNSGYRSTFCGCILPMLRSSYKDPFCPQAHQLQKFLLHFYDMTETLISDACSEESRLLFGLTLMLFLRKFNKSSITSSTMTSQHWRIFVKLKGPWLGILWTSKSQAVSQAEKRRRLLVILSEMFIANITGKSFKRVWDCKNEVYVFGNDTSFGNKVPKTYFTITIHGLKKISSIFRSFLEDPIDQLNWRSNWPKNEFTLNLDIRCIESVKWGCSKSQHMEFGPFSEPNMLIDED